VVHLDVAKRRPKSAAIGREREQGKEREYKRNARRPKVGRLSSAVSSIVNITLRGESVAVWSKTSPRGEVVLGCK
jgi:hypothetical protein